MDAQMTTGCFHYPQSGAETKLVVEVGFWGDIAITGNDGQKIKIDGQNVREAYWLSDALTKAGELSKKRPLSNG
jgi:hypothetical protein